MILHHALLSPKRLGAAVGPKMPMLQLMTSAQAMDPAASSSGACNCGRAAHGTPVLLARSSLTHTTCPRFDFYHAVQEASLEAPQSLGDARPQPGDLLQPLGTVQRQALERVAAISYSPCGTMVLVLSAGKSLELLRCAGQACCGSTARSGSCARSSWAYQTHCSVHVLCGRFPQQVSQGEVHSMPSMHP